MLGMLLAPAHLYADFDEVLGRLRDFQGKCGGLNANLPDEILTTGPLAPGECDGPFQ